MVKLDLIDRKLIAELDENCRIPTTVLARRVGKSRQAVEYRINRLVKEGVILNFQTSFNPHKIGYQLYKIYIKLKNLPERRANLLALLRSNGIVYWLGEFSGKWDLIFAIFLKDDYALYELKNKIHSEFSDIIEEETGDALLDVRQYPKMYFTGALASPTIFAGAKANVQLDELDFRILSLIMNDARISSLELARLLQTTATTITNRMKRMENEGVIVQYRISVDHKALDLELYKAIIKIDRYTKEDEMRLLEYLSQLPNIQYFIRNIWQIEPEFIVRNYHEYHEIIEKLKQEFPHVIRTVDSLLMLTDEWTPGFRNLLNP